MQTIKKVITSLIIFFVLNANAQNTPDFSKKLSKYLALQKERLHFNGTVLVACKDSIMYEKAIGFTSLENKVPLTLNSKFKIASVSKSFTGTLIAMAINEGKLKLEDKLTTYFPEYGLTKDWQQVTIKHLVTHTSGIPHWKGVKDYWSKKALLPLSTKQVLPLIFNMEVLFPPGDRVSYSSPAYYLLATILEYSYQTSYKELLKTKITDKLQLKNTGVFDETTIINQMTKGYHILANNKLIPAPYRNSSTLKGGGSLYSNTKDLLKWNMSVIDNKTWDKDLTKLIFSNTTNKTMPHNNNANYGMGWYIHSSNDRPKSYQVSGGTFGYSCISAIYPKDTLSIIILSNVSFLPVNTLWADIEKIVFNAPFELPEIITPKKIPKGILNNLKGTYVADNGMKLKVIAHNNQLFVKLGNHLPLEIILEHKLMFKARKINITFIFKKDSEGNIKTLTTTGRGEKHNFKKLVDYVK